MQPEEVLAQMGIAQGQEKGSDVVGGREGGNAKPPTRITSKMITYDQIVDALLLSPPHETQGQLALRLGYSQSWLSRMIASDAFQAKLADRLEKDIEPERREVFRLRFASIEEEARGVLLASLKKLSERLENPVGVPDELLVRSAGMAGKLLGYGARPEQQPVKVDMHVHLETLAGNLRKLNHAPSVAGGQAGTVIEGEVIPK